MLKGAVTILAALVCVTQLQAEEYPAHPIHMVVPFPPGGGTDVLGRIVGQRLNE